MKGAQNDDIGRIWDKIKTYTWFSPLGEKDHAATAMATHITKPMMTLHLRESVLAGG